MFRESEAAEAVWGEHKSGDSYTQTPEIHLRVTLHQTVEIAAQTVIPEGR